MSEPRASFVIPAYNAQPWIAETLESCLDQTIKQIEIVVVNDGSTDHTKEIVEGIAKKDKRIVLVDLEKNVGRSEARNIGNLKASADILCVLDSDDKATRNRVKDTLACFSLKNPDLVYGGFITIDTFGNMDKRYIPEPFRRDVSLKDGTHYICHSTLAYRKGVARNIKYAEGKYSDLGIDDWKFIWDSHLAGYKFAYIKSPLCYHRSVDWTVSFTRNNEDVGKAKKEYYMEKALV
jgi:glycosyltransferase involved in cell wall biosynthesis